MQDLHTDFHEKAIFVKADVAAATTVRVGYPCHASIRTLCELTPCGSVHKMRSVFVRVLYRRCHLPSGLSSLRVDQVRLRSRLTRSETIG
jgi:hypothetical protein